MSEGDPWTQFIAWWNRLPLYQKVLLAGAGIAPLIGIAVITRRR